MKKLFALILCLVTSGVAHAGIISTRSTAPTACAVGDVWINPGAATNDRIYTCTATNTWTKNSGRPWVIQSTAPSDLSLIWFDDNQVPGYLVLKLHNGTTWVQQAIGEGGTFNQAGDYTLTGSWDFTGATVTGISGGSMVYPGAGISISTGSAWGTSITPGTSVATALAAPVDGTGGLVSKAYVDAFPNIIFGTGLAVAEDTPSAGTDTVSIDADTTPTSGSAKPLTSGGAYTALAGKQSTLVSGTNIKTVNNTSLLGSGNIDISGGSGGYVSLSAAPYSDVACTTGQYGYYESTAYLCTGGFWTSKWTLTTHLNTTPSGETVLAQQNTHPLAYYNVSLYGNDSRLVGQSFQPTSAGSVNTIKVWYASSTAGACTMYARLGTTLNLSSTYSSSGSVSLSGATVPGEISIPITSVSLSTGTTYYIGVWTDCEYSTRVDLGYATGNTYSGGSLVGTTSGWPLFDDAIGNDLYFIISNNP